MKQALKALIGDVIVQVGMFLILLLGILLNLDRLVPTALAVAKPGGTLRPGKPPSTAQHRKKRPDADAGCKPGIVEATAAEEKKAQDLTVAAAKLEAEAKAAWEKAPAAEKEAAELDAQAKRDYRAAHIARAQAVLDKRKCIP